MDNRFYLLYADNQGDFYDHPNILALGRAGEMFLELREEDMIELPLGASLVLIPKGYPAGITPKGKFVLLEKDDFGKESFAVGALLPQGYTRTLLPAYRRKSGEDVLPLFGYSAVAFKEGKLYVGAIKTDDPTRWDPKYYNGDDLPKKIAKIEKENTGNRLISHLAHCALKYQCFTAQNIFYKRWEGGIPLSPACNANCLGCISLQESECCPAPQSRITFTPTPKEVAQIAVPHLRVNDGSIISFGQGCEGDPSLSLSLPSAIDLIRKETKLGTININTNAGFTKGITLACDAGLDSMRVSLISARKEAYQKYYRSKAYNLENVLKSIAYAKKSGVFVSLNLLFFPGFSDREEEFEALVKLITDYRIDMVQFRNLNIDPDWFLNEMPASKSEVMGVFEYIESLNALPKLIIGNFLHPLS